MRVGRLENEHMGSKLVVFNVAGQMQHFPPLAQRLSVIFLPRHRSSASRAPLTGRMRCETPPSQVLVRRGSSLLSMLLRNAATVGRCMKVGLQLKTCAPQTSTSSLLPRDVSVAASGEEKPVTVRGKFFRWRKCCTGSRIGNTQTVKTSLLA